jgi:hypothetical protein
MRQKMNSDESRFEWIARKMRKMWFARLPEDVRDSIIKPHFEKAFPTNEAKRELRKMLEGTPGWYSGERNA